jgi:hypothetical protein
MSFGLSLLGIAWKSHWWHEIFGTVSFRIGAVALAVVAMSLMLCCIAAFVTAALFSLLTIVVYTQHEVRITLPATFSLHMQS